MIEVIWHGRGGQGAFTAARLLAAGYSAPEGKHALAFPSFGPERRGAPMRAFSKLSDAPIGDRSACASADVVVYLDDTLFAEGWDVELKPGGFALVNSVQSFSDPRIVTVDADGVSTAILGRAIPNTALLAQLTRMVEGFDRSALAWSIENYMPRKLHEKNLAIVDAVLGESGVCAR